MQAVKLFAHFNERIDFEPDTVDHKQVVALTYAIVILETQVQAYLLRMALVAPEIAGIAKGVAEV